MRAREVGGGTGTEGPFAHHRTTFDRILDEMETQHWSLERLSAALDKQVTDAVLRAAWAMDAESGNADAAAEDSSGDWMGDPRIEDEPPGGSFGYIPIALPRLLGELCALDAALAADPDYALSGVASGPRYRPVRFIEIGCGHGRNLALLRDSGALEWLSLAGIDISPRMIALGQRALGLKTELAVGDAMSVDLSGQDVVYTYRPFRDDRLEARFERHLIATMKVSAYLLAPLTLVIGSSRRMVGVGETGSLYKKIA